MLGGSKKHDVGGWLFRGGALNRQSLLSMCLCACIMLPICLMQPRGWAAVWVHLLTSHPRDGDTSLKTGTSVYVLGGSCVSSATDALCTYYLPLVVPLSSISGMHHTRTYCSRSRFFELALTSCSSHALTWHTSTSMEVRPCSHTACRCTSTPTCQSCASCAYLALLSALCTSSTADRRQKRKLLLSPRRPSRKTAGKPQPRVQLKKQMYK